MIGQLHHRKTRGQWLALTAALLGWMFDGLEMGLFPLVSRPALRDLLPASVAEKDIGQWIAIATAAFLIGAATGGVVFGWLGDRLGRVRAMSISVLTYAIFTGLCCGAWQAWHIVALRFIAALGMGGEWSLGVALVMEVWPDGSRAWMAGLIGAAANFGYMFVGVFGLLVVKNLETTKSALQAIRLPNNLVDQLTRNDAWRLLMLTGVTPALLTFFVRLYVPESQRWQREKSLGTTQHWRTSDLIGVSIGAVAAIGIIWLWSTAM
ncbi:MAG: MFS transporter, partial [Candidatus Acidiferrum sp.]